MFCLDYLSRVDEHHDHETETKTMFILVSSDLRRNNVKGKCGTEKILHRFLVGSSNDC